MSSNEVAEFVRTLFASGFNVLSVERKPNFTLVHADRHDEFGLTHDYMFAYAGQETVSEADRNALVKLSRNKNAPLVIVTDRNNQIKGSVVLSPTAFFGKVGGAINSVLALEPDYGSRLNELGFNRLPIDLKGKPDDIFESYVHAGLQFLLRGRVIRYGQERRFEAVSDGITVGRNTPLLLYDCKASADHYEFNRNAIRQFADYVADFHTRYEQSVGRLYAFLVISSEFQSVDTLRERSDELYAACGIPMVCLTAETLSALVALFSEQVALRTVVDWKKILRSPKADIGRAKEEFEARLKDRILGASRGNFS